MQNMADLIGVNKSSVYRFLKKENISPTIVQNNTQYYSSIALQRVKNTSTPRILIAMKE